MLYFDCTIGLPNVILFDFRFDYFVAPTAMKNEGLEITWKDYDNGKVAYIQVPMNIGLCFQACSVLVSVDRLCSPTSGL